VVHKYKFNKKICIYANSFRPAGAGDLSMPQSQLLFDIFQAATHGFQQDKQVIDEVSGLTCVSFWDKKRPAWAGWSG
jgi:hypothetical protein